MTLLSLYNQDQLDDEDFIENFVARGAVLQLIVNGLRHMASAGETEHQILIGMRGMGKTSMLRRVALAIADDAALRATFVPLRFREEQYNVLSLDTLWRNCGEALAEWCEENGHAAMAERIDRAVDTREWRTPDKAVAGLLGFCSELGKRPVLLIDNLDLILDNLRKDGWALRHILQREDGPFVIGAATQFPAEFGDRNAPFYEFFHPILLEPLTENELLQCMLALSERRGEIGQPVRDVLAKAPERIRTLYTLTGGNPRVLALIYRLLEQAESEKILDDLGALLDQVTPFYKARVEEFQAAQQRAIIDAIALHWDPITSGTLSEVTGIAITTISSQLNRLRQTGFIQQVDTSGSYSGYQLSERFLNIWYLMRHGTRRAKQRLRWLTIFLARLFNEEELSRMAARADAGGWRADFCASVREAYSEVRARRLSVADNDRLDRAGDDADIVAAAEVQRQAIAASQADRWEDAAVLWGTFVSRFDGSRNPDLQPYVAEAWNNEGVALDRLNRKEEAIDVFDEMIERYGPIDQENLRAHVARACTYKGITLAELDRNLEAIAVFDEAISRFGSNDQPDVQLEVVKAWVSKAATLGGLGHIEEAIDVCDELLARFRTNDAPAVQEELGRAWRNKGVALVRSGRLLEALDAYDELVENTRTSDQPALLEQAANAQVSRGDIFGLLARYEEAIDAYSASIALFTGIDDASSKPALARALSNQGVLLAHLNRQDEALTTLDELLDRFGQNDDEQIRRHWAQGMGGKARLLFDRWGRYAEAEMLNRQALASQNDKSCRVNLVWTIIAQGRADDAQAARDALTDISVEGLALIDAGVELIRDNLGNAFAHLGTALDRDMDEGDNPYFEDILWLLRIGADRGHGERLIEWFVESSNHDRYAPIYGALLAYVRGARFLRDLNPEVRGVAERLYERISAPRRHRESEGRNEAKKSRRKKSR